MRCWRISHKEFPHVTVIDLGGGIGVADRSGTSGMDLAALERGVAELKRRFPRLSFWMEPGRFLVANAGVLVAQVTQLKGKGEVRYVGIATGMNSLIRPALYDALSRDRQPHAHRASRRRKLTTIVGPICESADKLGSDRWLPATARGRRAADRELRRLRLRDGVAL